MGKKTLNIDTVEKFKIYFDPFKQDIINCFKSNPSPLNVKDIAQILEVQHGKVHYHVKKLLYIEAIVLDHTKSINGITSKYFTLNFDDVNINYKSKEKNYDEFISEEVKNTLTDVIDKNKNLVLKAYKNEKDKIENGNESFGIHLFDDDVYLSIEERKQLSSIINDFIKKHEKKPKDTNNIIPTHLFSIIFDNNFNK